MIKSYPTIKFYFLKPLKFYKKKGMGHNCIHTEALAKPTSQISMPTPLA